MSKEPTGRLPTAESLHTHVFLSVGQALDDIGVAYPTVGAISHVAKAAIDAYRLSDCDEALEALHTDLGFSEDSIANTLRMIENAVLYRKRIEP